MRYSIPTSKARAGVVLLVGFALSAVGAGGPPLKSPLEATPLFDGKTLDGWEGTMKYWSVVDGAIVGKNADKVPVSTYLVTKKKYTDFRLTAKVKLANLSEMHSGIAFWGRLAPEKGEPFTYMGHLVMFPSDYGMYDLHRRGGLPVDGKPAKKVGKQHDWNDLEILATGHRVRVAINGVAVADFTDPKPELVAEGPIALQLHSNDKPQEVLFKDLMLEEMPKDDALKTVK